MRRLSELADETVPYVVSSQVRLSMEKFAEEWAKRMLRDEAFNRRVVDEALRAFLGASRQMRGGRKRGRAR